MTDRGTIVAVLNYWGSAEAVTIAPRTNPNIASGPIDFHHVFWRYARRNAQSACINKVSILQFLNGPIPQSRSF